MKYVVSDLHSPNKAVDAERIEQDIARFRASGGHIEKIPAGKQSESALGGRKYRARTHNGFEQKTGT